ncbi:hypothetical protein LCGC14_0548120 [marine sediment metagenome]|uniref:Transposase IS891/IS1136/IS1341 domain-containing protein n=1 Tax=marine sediment metagenome TaxID=412755 RepID=A0A0F9UC52_9ZZZZ
MKLVATIKVKIKHNKELLDMSNTFLQAVQYSIDKGFEAKVSNRFKLHHLVYKDLRQWLPADFSCEAIAKASENLKAVKLKKKPIMKSCPISFNRNLFTFSFDKVRIATFTPRQRKNIAINIPEYYWKYLDWRYQTLEIIKDRKGRLFFHITFSRDVNTTTSCRNEKIVGVDVGVNNLAVTSDGEVFSGYKTKIMQYQYLRKKLQRKGTKSAKRKLKAISGRQKRYMRGVNHIISKEIVASANTIVLENLKGIRKSRNKYSGKRLNRWLNSWSFYQLQGFIKYKAEREGKRVIFVSPYMTSQTCSNCLKIGSRYFDSFFCSHCGFSSQSDFNASCNLRRLHVTKPNVSNGEGKGQLTTEPEFRDKSPLL